VIAVLLLFRRWRLSVFFLQLAIMPLCQAEAVPCHLCVCLCLTYSTILSILSGGWILGISVGGELLWALLFCWEGSAS
jgi:hypothetical protein